MPSFVIRCDGSLSIGMGHVLRSLALAHALRERGCTVVFALRDLPGNALSSVARAGFKTSLLPDGNGRHESTLPEREAAAIVDVANGARAVCALVDHHGTSPRYLRDLADAGLLVGVIDDMAEQDLTAADWLLNQNLGASAMQYRTRIGCVKLLGPRYALLRAEFARSRANLSRRFSPQDRNVLVTLGGGDTVELACTVLQSLDLVARPLEIRCVLGGEVSPSPRIGQAGASSRHEVKLLRNVTSMADQMAWADVSVNAGGSTCWELCCLGVPMIVFATSADQELNASALGEMGCAKSLGEWRGNGDAADLANSVQSLLADPERRAEMSQKGQSVVEGLGAMRAADSLLAMEGIR